MNKNYDLVTLQIRKIKNVPLRPRRKNSLNCSRPSDYCAKIQKPYEWITRNISSVQFHSNFLQCIILRVSSNLMVKAFGVLAFRSHAQERALGIFPNGRIWFPFMSDKQIFNEINVHPTIFILEKL